MTIEEVKSYLGRAFYLDKRIQCFEEEISMIESHLYKCTPSYNNVGGSTQSTFEFTLDRLLNYRDRLNNEWDELIKAKKQIKSTIDSLSDDIQRLVLVERYINYKSYEDIARNLGYSVRQIHNIKKQAIKNISLNFTIEV